MTSLFLKDPVGGTGKKYLVAFLKALTIVGATVEFDSVEAAFGNSQTPLLNAYFVIVNEATAVEMAQYTAKFKHMQDGDTFTIKEKFMPNMIIDNHLRFIFCSNEDTFVSSMRKVWPTEVSTNHAVSI